MLVCRIEVKIEISPSKFSKSLGESLARVTDLTATSWRGGSCVSRGTYTVVRSVNLSKGTFAYLMLQNVVAYAYRLLIPFRGHGRVKHHVTQSPDTVGPCAVG